MKRDSDLSQAVGRRLREFQEIENVSNKDIAEAIGMGIPQVRAYRRGDNLLTLTSLVDLVQRYEIDPRWMLLGDDSVPMIMNRQEMLSLSNMQRFQIHVYGLTEILQEITPSDRTEYLAILMTEVGNGIKN